ncbi:hypothetical protein AAFN46_02965 [Pseudomonas sp. CAU 1711]|uniref:hypothetical protein n=1 Tax=Pseudomonas sp. CAU 1711 TaxID=3140356 RepID=UPI003260253A
MKASSQTMMLAFGLALAMLAVSTLVAALELSRQVATAELQAQAWKAYALSLHGHDPQDVHGAAVPAPAPLHAPLELRAAQTEWPQRTDHPSPGLRF